MGKQKAMWQQDMLRAEQGRDERDRTADKGQSGNPGMQKGARTGDRQEEALHGRAGAGYGQRCAISIVECIAEGFEWLQVHRGDQDRRGTPGVSMQVELQRRKKKKGCASGEFRAGNI